MTGWPSRSLTGGRWSMNDFRDGISCQPDGSSDDDIQRNVESLVASFQPEAVDVSPPIGFDGRGYLSQNHELHRAGQLEIPGPGRRPALSGRTGRIDVQCVLGAHVASSGIAQHDTVALETGSACRDRRGRPEAALDVEHVVHNVRTVCKEGTG